MFKDKNLREELWPPGKIIPLYKPITLKNLRTLPQVQHNFTQSEIFEMEVVATVLPFRANNYIVEKLIDWKRVPDDPIFNLTFPRKEMLTNEHFNRMAKVIRNSGSRVEIARIANQIRNELNPHPSGQQEYNVPVLNDERLEGLQHKYNETVLFFPRRGQTCHAYCTFCFRWPQFVSMNADKFAMKDISLVIEYIKKHPEVTDLLITGGDPMVMKAGLFDEYISALIGANIPNLKTIRIGSKALSYWPYRFVSDPDSDQMLRSFEKIRKSGIHLSFMAHFNHYRELQTEAVAEAVRRINKTGAVIRTQSPVFNHINNDPKVWIKLWEKAVSMKIVPYYMFIARDTGAHDYFSVKLEEAWNIFRRAYRNVSGIARTVRGPVMSGDPGKVEILGVSEIHGKKVFNLRFIQARNPEWVDKPFYAKYDPDAEWITDLKPALGNEKFFFRNGLEDIHNEITELQEEIIP